MEKTLQKWDKKYPKLLKEIPDPPEKLYYQGDLKVVEKPCLAVVGTRKNTDYGEDMTRQIIRELSVLDIAIVSGLAKGIDTIAHKAALENDLPTIAVLGSGMDNIYPVTNQKLATEIIKNGLILSEYENGTPPLQQNFPQRNRIISGLSIATIVIEAPEKSGALITGRFAIEQNREIFILPGDVDRENSIGIIKFLQKNGGYPITSGQDIIEVLKDQPHLFKLDNVTKPEQETTENIFNLTKEQQLLFSLLKDRHPITIEKLEEKTKLQIQEILTALSILEIYGLIIINGGKYRRA